MKFGGGHSAHSHSRQKYAVLFPLNSHVYQDIAPHITSIILETHPCLQHAKYRKHTKNHHPGCCRAIYTHQFSLFFTYGRTSSGVGTKFWGNLLGLRWSLEEGTLHTPTDIQNMVFLFPRNLHVYQAIALHIISIMLETHPCLQHAKPRKRPENHHPGCCRAIYTRHFLCFFACGRTSSGVG